MIEKNIAELRFENALLRKAVRQREEFINDLFRFIAFTMLLKAGLVVSVLFLLLGQLR